MAKRNVNDTPVVLVPKIGKAETDALKAKHKNAIIKDMSAKDVAEIVQLLAILAGIANPDGSVK